MLAWYFRIPTLESFIVADALSAATIAIYAVTAPLIALIVGGARLSLDRLISNLSWVEDAGFIVEGIGGGNLPRPSRREKDGGVIIGDEFDLSYFPEPTNDEALLALALMREGRGLNHPAYAFLFFSRS